MTNIELVHVKVSLADEEESTFECVGETFAEAFDIAFKKAQEYIPRLKIGDDLTISTIYDCGCGKR